MTDSMQIPTVEQDSFATTSTDRSEAGFDRHRGPVTCVAGIPGRSAAISSGYDSAVGIIDFARGRIDLLGYHRHLVNRVVVNSSGTLAATCSSDYTVCLWDLKSLKPMKLLRGHWDDVEDFAFIDNERGISVSRDRRIFIWNLTTGAIIRVLGEHQRDVLSVEYAEGSVYSSGDDMTLRQWSLDSGALIRTWGPFDVETDTCAIDTLHDRVILGCDDGKIRIFNCIDGEPIQTISAHRSGIKKVAVSPATGDILSAAYDQRILVWDALTFDLKIELDSHDATWERSFNWSPDGQNILAGTFDGTVLRWDALSGRLCDEIGADTLPAGNACINDVYSSDQGFTALVSDDGFIRTAMLSTTESRWLETVEPMSGRILMNAVCLKDEDGTGCTAGMLIAGAHDQNLHVFSIQDGKLGPEIELALNEGPINCIRMAQSQSGRDEAFVACYSGAVVRVSLDEPESISIVNRLGVHDGAVKAVRIHPTNKAGISGAADGSLCAWNFDGEIIQRFAGHTAIVDDVDFDPDGVLFASVSRDFTVNVYEFETGTLLHSILLGRESPKCVLFWDCNTVIVGNYWGDLWLVDLEQERVTAHRIAANGISSLSRCAFGLVAVSYDGSVCLVDPGDMSVIDRLRSMRQKLSGYEERGSCG